MCAMHGAHPGGASLIQFALQYGIVLDKVWFMLEYGIF